MADRQAAFQVRGGGAEIHFHGVLTVFTVAVLPDWAPPAREPLGVMVTVHTVPCRSSSGADQIKPGGQILHGPLGGNASRTPCAAPGLIRSASASMSPQCCRWCSLE